MLKNKGFTKECPLSKVKVNDLRQLHCWPCTNEIYIMDMHLNRRTRTLVYIQISRTWSVHYRPWREQDVKWISEEHKKKLVMTQTSLNTFVSLFSSLRLMSFSLSESPAWCLQHNNNISVKYSKSINHRNTVKSGNEQSMHTSGITANQCNSNGR